MLSRSFQTGGTGANDRSGPSQPGPLKADEIINRISVSPEALMSLSGEGRMTRFQRILSLTAACGIIAIGIAYVILVLFR
jgi:hypothetical protein